MKAQTAIIAFLLALIAVETSSASETIRLHIDPRPPLGFSPVEWHNTAMLASAEWFVAAGNQALAVETESAADVIVRTAEMQHAGITYRDWYPKRIFVNVAIPRGCSLRGILLHEFGHVAGLDHRSGSIMEPVHSGRDELTRSDRDYIRDVLKRHPLDRVLR